ncbi:hypothetical protein [Lentilactobacillus sp. SPB1-3]|uniref:Uncharacterized protein n=1 Tax=Lentilactobacillus terminaliae TaxID=3003483 RepID=A0ACD5DF12_9LACO|nr:hypothetical protein [Lentilactobacillus sp. SPB1-3]MCZ0977637.1 hypothetical protein [Lentilactobacillus sp. SPB1-3]
MNTKLRNTLLLSLTVFAMGTAASAVATQTVGAKSAVKVTVNKAAKAAATDRNFVPTGTNAIYTKAGTLKGARVVASTSTLNKLKNSNNSKDYFRAYQVAKTNRGSWYAKVVSFDYKYRGWIYVGKSNPDSDWSKVGGGLEQTETTRETSLPGTKTVRLTNPGTQNVIWNAPYRSQYRAEKVVTDTEPYGGEDFTVTKALEMKREGTPYYYIVNNNDSKIQGWIYAGSVIEEVPVPDQNANNIVYAKIVDADSGYEAANVVLTDTKTNLSSPADFVTTELGNGSSDEAKLGAYAPGYTYKSLTATQQSANYSAIANAKYGSTVTVLARRAAAAPADQLHDTK